MVQVLDNEKEPKYRILLEEIIVIEELPVEDVPEVIEEETPKVEQEKDQKRAIRKLLKKAKYNPNYLKETKRIQDVKNQMNFRRYAVY